MGGIGDAEVEEEEDVKHADGGEALGELESARVHGTCFPACTGSSWCAAVPDECNERLMGGITRVRGEEGNGSGCRKPISR